MKIEVTLELWSKRVALTLSEAEAKEFRKAEESGEWDAFLGMIQHDVNDSIDWYLDAVRVVSE